MNKTIFIADDNRFLLNTMRTALNSQPGFEVCGQAENGLEAIEKAASLHPDLIVLDLSMPVMNGLEAAHSLRQMMPGVPIILFTMHHTRLACTEAVCAGVSAVASKVEGIKGLISEAKKLLRD